MIVIFNSPEEKKHFNVICDVFDNYLCEIKPFYSATYIDSYAFGDFGLENLIDVIRFHLIREKERSYSNGGKS